jgi:hypothetical protein
MRPQTLLFEGFAFIAASGKDKSQQTSQMAGQSPKAGGMNEHTEIPPHRETMYNAQISKYLFLRVILKLYHHSIIMEIDYLALANNFLILQDVIANFFMKKESEREWEREREKLETIYTLVIQESHARL